MKVCCKVHRSRTRLRVKEIVQQKIKKGSLGGRAAKIFKEMGP
jgi:hypothetical protein